jgi:formylglycine-generating enzyme required for sulfatase activity
MAMLAAVVMALGCVAPGLSAAAGPSQGWPPYLKAFKPPAGRTWEQYRVRATDGMPQALIPAGEFDMGAADNDKDARADEKPRTKVSVGDFWMDMHTVTIAQYTKFVQDSGYDAGPEWRQWAKDVAQGVPGLSGLVPAVYVSYADAMAYAKWAGASLPTEAQWEKAARGGKDGLRFPWGDDANAQGANGDWDGKRALSYGDAMADTLPVCRRLANGFGLYDMAGNVWQWCRDGYSPTWYKDQPAPAKDPEDTAVTDLHVLRGGSWICVARDLRVSGRLHCAPGYRNNFFGFRCASAP